jgi:hypothetical protein
MATTATMGCVYCREAGTPFIVPKTLNGYYDLKEHFTEVHPGKVVHGNKVLTSAISNKVLT